MGEEGGSARDGAPAGSAPHLHDNRLPQGPQHVHRSCKGRRGLRHPRQHRRKHNHDVIEVPWGQGDGVCEGADDRHLACGTEAVCRHCVGELGHSSELPHQRHLPTQNEPNVPIGWGRGVDMNGRKQQKEGGSNENVMPNSKQQTTNNTETSNSTRLSSTSLGLAKNKGRQQMDNRT